MACVLAILPASAARPLLDRHQWDAYFALYARDVTVPWKPATVRLDTYSGAPVDFAAYNIDPADVVVAGANRSARAIDTSRLRPLVRWRFSPPPGYRFETNDVPVPLGSQEGFYVIEARRGDAIQQVWLNRTHVGLVTKESPGGLVLWGVDLHNGSPIAGMKISLLVGLKLIDIATDRSGIAVWRDARRPEFALAENRAGRAFVSLLPQPPIPSGIVGLRVESAAAHAGERVRFVGFARKHGPSGFRPGTGDARISLFGHGTTLATALVHLDQAGAFYGDIAIPAGVDAGDYAMLASAFGGVGGTSLHVDAVGDVGISVRSTCPCDASLDVPLSVIARRDLSPAPDVAVHVTIVRTPHVVPPGAIEETPRFGTTVVYDRTVRTDSEGRARVSIASPSDGLDSTYGIRATTHGATATSRIVVPAGKISLAVEPEESNLDVSEPAAFDIRGFDPSDGFPSPGIAVKVKLSHGASIEEQSVTLDARGLAHVVFQHPSLGTNLAIAEASDGARTVLDAAAVVVEPSALSRQTGLGSSEVTVTTDKTRYRSGERVGVNANAPGASGVALLSLEGARVYQTRLAPVSGTGVRGSLDLGDPQGAVKVSATLVRDGAIETGSADVNVDGPGHAREMLLALDKPAYDEGETAHVSISDGDVRSDATLAIRIADGRESGAALFDDAPLVMSVGATSLQAPASADPQWHAYVEPARSKANDIFAAERPRRPPPELPTIGVATPRTMYWHVGRATGQTVDVPVPKERGHFVISILKISDDGDVGASSVSFNVQ